MKKMYLNKLIKFCLFVFSVNTFALDNKGYTTESGINIKPLLVTSFYTDDNLFNENFNPSSSSIFTIEPSVNLLLDTGINQYEIDLSIDSVSYLTNSDDNFLDTRLNLSTHLEPSSQSRWDILVNSGLLNESRGSGLSENSINQFSEPLKYFEQLRQITYEYGGLSSKGRIAFDFQQYNKEYRNFETISRQGNFDSFLWGSVFTLTNNSNSDILFSYNVNDIDFEEFTLITRDSKVSNASLGFQWRSSALTTGLFSLGYQKRKFSDVNRTDFSGLSWDLNIVWTPLSYSSFSFTSSKNTKDPDNLIGDYIDENIYGLTWQHIWNERLNTSLGTTFNHEEYAGFYRRDNTKSLDLNVIYSLRPWVDFSFFIQILDKNSTQENITYAKNVIGLSFAMTI